MLQLDAGCLQASDSTAVNGHAIGRGVSEADALVARAITREPDAMRALVLSVGPIVHGRVAKALLRRRGSDGRDVRQEAEDLVQEVFLALFDDDARILRAWKPERGPFGHFVALIADHQVSSIFRSGRRRPWSDNVALLADPETDDGAPTADAWVASREELAFVLDGVRAAVSAKGWDVFVRLYVENQPVEVVAKALNLRLDAIYAWRTRLSKLARKIAQESAYQPPASSCVATTTHPIEDHAS
jgi:RNA polymerase sigma-70 factor (ECF subfamily)